jgi:hypothetical protein
MYLEVAGSGFSSGTKANDVVVDIVATPVATTSSYAGGQSLVINGFGFTENTVVEVCGRPCTIANPANDVAYNKLTC